MDKRIQRWIDKGMIRITDDCWIWEGCLNTDGYPKVGFNGNSNGKGHRVIYQLTHPEEDIIGKVIRHTCDNPRCVNPEHLLSGTNHDNMMDKMVRGRAKCNKLQPEEVKRMREIYNKGGIKQKELASMFGIDHRTVSYIVRNLTWKWVK